MTEYEAKFLIRRPEQVNQVLTTLSQLGFSVSERETATHVDRYFDTADWSILQSGWAYRCRKRDNRQKLTLKSLGSRNGAVFERVEIEQPLPKKRAGKKGRLPDGPVQQRLAEVTNDEWRHELFRVKNRRTVFEVVGPGDEPVHLELDLDRTRIRADKARKNAPGRFEFLELELEAHQPGVIDSLAEILRERHGLIPAKLSKFERGMQAAGLKIEANDASIGKRYLKGSTPVLKLVYQYLHRQLRALKRQQPRAWEGLDPAGVHKMRIAIRRSRSALRAFADGLPAAEYSHLDSELRWLLKQLGFARDADVCGAEVDRYRAALHGMPNSALAPFEAHLKLATLGAHSQLVDALASERYTSLIESFESFVESGPDLALQSDISQLSISDCEHEFVPAAVDKMLRRGKKITPDCSARRWHKLRLQAKRLRYLLELFRTAKPKKWRAPIAALSELQELLGNHQDAITARDKLAVYSESVQLLSSNRELLLAVGRLMQLEDDRAFECRLKFPAMWDRFKRSAA